MVEYHIDDATQYATIYRDGRPYATAIRRRIGQPGYEWEVFAVRGWRLFGATTTDGLKRLIKAKIG